MNTQAVKGEILLVEDSPSLASLYQSYLESDGYSTDIVENGAAALELLGRTLPDIMLLDLQLPDMSGMDVLKHVYDQGLDCSVIIITAHGSIDVAIEAMQLGAVDFITKPFDATRLKVTVGNAMDKRRLSCMVESYQRTFERDHFHGFVGSSMPMQAVYRIIESAAPSKATIFITGESGTGKELCAEAIHLESPRHDRNFVALNCAAIPRDLMESEIFGHVKGAFTGAAARREGAASRAQGGTLFLDEICEMDIDLQSKLLRFIQTGRYQRVGDSKEQLSDNRIICATNRDPLEEVRQGRFREDLYYRLNVIPIQLPSLRERGEDILTIAASMLQRMSREERKSFRGISDEVAEHFMQYSWPGNVRELENVIRNVVVLNDAEQIELWMLPKQLLEPTEVRTERVSPQLSANRPADDVQTTTGDATIPGGEIRPLWLEEKAIIERAIAQCDGNIPKAAALLDISASTIYRKRSAWEKANKG